MDSGHVAPGHVRGTSTERSHVDCERAAAPRMALVLASARLTTELERFLPALNLEAAFVSRVDHFSAAVETSCPEVLIIDTDLLALPGDLSRMAHSLRLDVITVALVNHWSEREERLRGMVDEILHKPPRRVEEWQQMFARRGNRPDFSNDSVHDAELCQVG